ncbi:hypothetical protein NPIL_265101 [Nephila pilipes]|uniref:Uncharacterized protein n=1 Tax=Nephila pilipes TaxID=299642 RepID=A0A8X6NBJ9_NEPPI|nr:hypothetical protein NPIL_265101 [Nephila pilipes]
MKSFQLPTDALKCFLKEHVIIPIIGTIRFSLSRASFCEIDAIGFQLYRYNTVEVVLLQIKHLAKETKQSILERVMSLIADQTLHAIQISYGALSH